MYQLSLEISFLYRYEVSLFILSLLFQFLNSSRVLPQIIFMAVFVVSNIIVIMAFGIRRWSEPCSFVIVLRKDTTYLYLPSNSTARAQCGPGQLGSSRRYRCVSTDVSQEAAQARTTSIRAAKPCAHITVETRNCPQSAFFTTVPLSGN